MAKKLSYPLGMGSALLFALGTTACSGKIVDLGNGGGTGSPAYADEAPTFASTDGGADGSVPFRIVDHARAHWYDNVFGVSPIAIRSGRLYFFLLPPPTPNGAEYHLQSCDVTRCASTLTVSSNRVGAGSGSFQIDANEAFWWDVVTPYTLKKCALAPQAPIEDVQLPTSGDPSVLQGFAISNGTIFWVSSYGVISQCDASDCTGTATNYAMTPPPGIGAATPTRIDAQDDQYLYLESAAIDAVGYPLVRVPKDPLAAFEIIGDMAGMRMASVHGENVYWAENIALGRLLSCPKSGCVGQPTVIAKGLSHPSEFVLDDNFVYILEPPTASATYTSQGLDVTISGRGRILKCPLTGCETPQTLYTSQGEIGISNLRVDDTFIYFTGLDCTHLDPAGWGNCGFIAAIPK